MNEFRYHKDRVTFELYTKCFPQSLDSRSMSFIFVRNVSVWPELKQNKKKRNTSYRISGFFIHEHARYRWAEEAVAAARRRRGAVRYGTGSDVHSHLIVHPDTDVGVRFPFQLHALGKRLLMQHRRGRGVAPVLVRRPLGSKQLRKLVVIHRTKFNCLSQ